MSVARAEVLLLPASCHVVKSMWNPEANTTLLSSDLSPLTNPQNFSLGCCPEVAALVLDTSRKRDKDPVS